MSTHLNDVPSAVAVAAALPPVVLTGLTNGGAIDLGDADGPCFAVQAVGALAEDCTLASALQQSDTGTSWSAIADGVFVDSTEGNTTQTIRFTRNARYVRWTGTPTGGDPGPSAAVAVVIGQEKKVF